MFSKVTNQYINIQHNDNQHNGQHNVFCHYKNEYAMRSIETLSIMTLNAYAECTYAELLVLSAPMPSVFMSAQVC
jgi:hypothetical protein